MASGIEDVKLLTPAECAALWRVDSKTVSRWANAGKLPVVRTPGGGLRFREDQIRPLLKGESPRSLRAVDAA